MDTTELIYEEYKRYRNIIDGRPNLGFSQEALRLQADFNGFRRGYRFTSKNERSALLTSFRIYNDRLDPK